MKNPGKFHWIPIKLNIQEKSHYTYITYIYNMYINLYKSYEVPIAYVELPINHHFQITPQSSLADWFHATRLPWIRDRARLAQLVFGARPWIPGVKIEEPEDQGTTDVETWICHKCIGYPMPWLPNRWNSLCIVSPNKCRKGSNEYDYDL